MARRWPSKWGISSCFHCGKQLCVKKGGGFIFDVILDPDGHELRVHREHVEPALGDGYRRKPQPQETKT